MMTMTTKLEIVTRLHLVESNSVSPYVLPTKKSKTMMKRMMMMMMMIPRMMTMRTTKI
jgi:hypothetical protein